MQDLWKKLCSPRHLMVFEAAARCASFTRAAQELNVQQPAVSATVKQLEERIGTALFARSHRQVTLTVAGERLFADVSRAFAQMAKSADAIQQLKQSNYVTLSASTAFNNYWMMPRLADLQAQYPVIDLRLQSSDREPDINANDISLAIRLGAGNWPGCESAAIADEIIYPVAAPQLMRSAINLTNIAGLLHQRLIHLEEPVRERPSWRDWFAHFDIRHADLRGGLRLNDYALVLQAAMAGEGFAFGWHHITEKLIAQGLLAARAEWQWQTGKRFYLVWSKWRPLSRDELRVKDWILHNGYGPRPRIGKQFS